MTSPSVQKHKHSIPKTHEHKHKKHSHALCTTSNYCFGTRTNVFPIRFASSRWIGDGCELKKHSATHVTKVGENGETVSISVSAEESHESTLSGTFLHFLFTHKNTYTNTHTHLHPHYYLNPWFPFAKTKWRDSIRCWWIAFSSSATCNDRNTRRRWITKGRSHDSARSAVENRATSRRDRKL